MRERKSAEEIAAGRLRSIMPVVPRAVSPPPDPGPGDLAAGGGPLSWSDIIPAWPEDVDLEHVPLPGGPRDGFGEPPAALAPELDLAVGPPYGGGGGERGAVVGVRSPAPTSVLAPPPTPASAEARPAGEWAGFPVGSAWATPPGVGHPEKPFRSGDAVDPIRSSLPAGGVLPVAPGVSATGAVAADYRKPLPPPTWVLPEEPVDREAWPGEAEEPALDDYPEEKELTPAGAFGRGVGAFDPGRRGVRALAAVAVLVLVVAAVLAWRARPRVDPVAPAPFGATQSADETADSPMKAGGGPASSAAEVVVAVGGKVRKPGLVRLPPGSRVADALTAAGGAEPGVDVALLNLARKVVDGELILVGVTPSPGMAAPAGPTGGAPAGGPVNLNTATLADLDTLPGVGPVLAQRILDAREAQGGFTAVSDLRKVDGIGDARYEQLKDLVTV